MSPVIQFMGTHQTRFDAKGRMSIPAVFRNELRTKATGGSTALVMWRSPKHACIETWPVETFQALAPSVERLDMFSDDEDDLTTALYADAWPVEPDKEGRIVVPESLVQHAALTDSAVFMGKGRHFQIWEPAAALQRIDRAREGFVARGLTLSLAKATPA